MKIRLFILGLVCLIAKSPIQSQTTYSSFDDFKDAVSTAQAGDEIILAKGKYEGGSISLKDIHGTASEPIIIRAEEIGADTIDGGAYFDFRKCSYIILQGFVINITEKSTTVKLQASNNIQITQNVFNGIGEDYYKDDGVSRNSSVWISIQGLWDDAVTLSHHNRIDNNLFMNKHTLGNMIKIDGTNELYVSQYDIIENNHFMNMGPRATNEMEVLRIGWSEMSESEGFTVVQNNLFEDCNGDPEIISVKCNKNTIAHNTFRRCQGTLSLRHGNESIVDGNFFFGEGVEGTGGIRFYGTDHVIINNYFQNLTGTKWDAPITITHGDAEQGNSDLTKHFRIERATISNNTLVNNYHGIEIGYDNNGKYTKPARDVIMSYNVIINDTNAAVKYIDSPDNMQWISNIAQVSGTGVLGEGVSFTSDQVNETAPELIFVDSLGYYKATSSSPGYSPLTEIGAKVLNDLDGQVRNSTTNYGADEYSTDGLKYLPLKASDVGPSLGEYLNTSTRLISSSARGETIDLLLMSNLDWQVQSSDNWIVVSKANGSGYETIQVEINENTSGLLRSGQISVTTINSEGGNNLSITILVEQADIEPAELNVTEELLEFNSESAEKSINISSNVSWSVTSNEAWVSLRPEGGNENGNVLISVEENTSAAPRKAVVTVTHNNNLFDTVKIWQAGAVGDEVKLNIIGATASIEQTDEGNIANNVFDGDLTNRWSGQGDGATITMELEGESRLAYIKVGLFKGEERSSYFDVLISLNNIEFTEALTDIKSVITEDSFIIYDLAESEAKYIQIVGHGNSANDWNSFTEFEVWGWKKELSSNDKNESHKSPIIYPNPALNSVTLSCALNTEVKIIDVSGKVIFQTITASKEDVVDINLERGLYYVLFQKESTRTISKLVVK